VEDKKQGSPHAGSLFSVNPVWSNDCLETLDEQGEDEQDETCEKEPEGVGGDEGDGDDLAQETEDAQQEGNPEGNVFRRGKFHLHSPFNDPDNKLPDGIHAIVITQFHLRGCGRKKGEVV
jgi:hypothetical protein